MEQTNPETRENTRHHFLFHIFKWDQKENPMPVGKAEVLKENVRKVWIKCCKKQQGEK